MAKLEVSLVAGAETRLACRYLLLRLDDGRMKPPPFMFAESNFLANAADALNHFLDVLFGAHRVVYGLLQIFVRLRLRFCVAGRRRDDRTRRADADNEHEQDEDTHDVGNHIEE